MSRSLGSSLPRALLDRLTGPASGRWLEWAVVVLSVDPLGWPHPAMVSYGELAAIDARRLRLGLRDGSASGRHLRENGHLTLVAADPALCLYVKGEAAEVPVRPEAPGLARFEMLVREVLADRAEGDEAGLTLVSPLAVAWPGGLAEAAARASRLRAILLA